MEAPPPIARLIAYLPPALLGALVAWTSSVALLSLPTILALLAVIPGVAAIMLAVPAIRRPNIWTDRATLGLVGGAFLGLGFLGAPLGLEILYLFVVLALAAAQLMRFRTITLPLGQVGVSEEVVWDGMRVVYLSFLVRVLVVAALVYFLSIMIYAAASASIIGLTTEVTAFVLALAILLILVGIAALRR